MGEAGRQALRVGFEGTIKLEFHGAKVSSDAGLFPYRDIGAWFAETKVQSHSNGPAMEPARVKWEMSGN